MLAGITHGSRVQCLIPRGAAAAPPLSLPPQKPALLRQVRLSSTIIAVLISFGLLQTSEDVALYAEEVAVPLAHGPAAAAPVPAYNPVPLNPEYESVPRTCHSQLHVGLRTIIGFLGL